MAPADVDSPLHTPDEVRSFSPIPMDRLPFPSIVVASADDSFYTMPRAAAFAAAWGSRLVTLDRAGHINAEAGYGPWPEGRRLLADARQAEGAPTFAAHPHPPELAGAPAKRARPGQLSLVLPVSRALYQSWPSPRRREEAMKPARFEYLAPRALDEALARSPSTATAPRSWPAARASSR